MEDACTRVATLDIPPSTATTPTPDVDDLLRANRRLASDVKRLKSEVTDWRSKDNKLWAREVAVRDREQAFQQLGEFNAARIAPLNARIKAMNLFVQS